VDRVVEVDAVRPGVAGRGADGVVADPHCGLVGDVDAIGAGAPYGVVLDHPAGSGVDVERRAVGVGDRVVGDHRVAPGFGLDAVQQGAFAVAVGDPHPVVVALAV